MFSDLFKSKEQNLINNYQDIAEGTKAEQEKNINYKT